MQPSPWLVTGVADPIPDPEAILPRDKHWTPAAHWSWNTRHVVKQAYLQGLTNLLRAEHAGPEHAEGSGLIWIGGDGPGGELWLQSCVGVHRAREEGYDGPIEMWFDSKTEKIEPELVADCGDIRIRDLQAVNPKPRQLGGWPNKSVALLHSTFRYTIRMDADCYPTANPAPLFAILQETPFAYWEEGTYVNWARVWPPGSKGVPGVQGGQILVDRVAAWKLILGAAFIDLHRQFYYPDKNAIPHLLKRWHQYGDQVALQIALAVMRTLGIPMDFRVLGSPRFIQSIHEYRHENQVWFVHRVRDKMHSQGWTPKPGVYKEPEAHQALQKCMYRKRNSRDAFADIYKHNKWGQGSGPGSDATAARPWIVAVNRQLAELGGRSASIVDLGCGDGRLAVHYETQAYQGIDCVPVKDWPAMLSRRVLDFWRHRTAIQPADLWIMKDVLHHWPLEMVRDWLLWAKDHAPCKRLLLCQDTLQGSQDIILGQLRGLDPEREPLTSFGLLPVGRYGKPEKAMLLLRR